MYGFSLRPAFISGGGPRSTMFSNGVNDPFRGPALGQVTDQEWYNEAKRELAKYDSFVDRLRKIASRQVRDDLADRYVGDPSDTESGIYRRNSVQANLAEAESYTPVNYFVFAQPRVQNRVRKLDDINDGFERAVVAAERQWGVLPEPQIVERIVQVQMPGAPAPTPPIVPILLGGVGLVAVLALLGVFGGD